MLINSKELLVAAKHERLAVPHFNINNLENIKWLLEVAEEEKYPIIIGVSEGAIKYLGSVKVVASTVKALMAALHTTQDVVLHLDHGSSFEICKDAIDSGFTSVMYDGSKLPIEENIKNTIQVIDYAITKNVSVEGELGYLGTTSDKISYTKVEDALYYLKNAKVNSLAVAIGNAHGIYKEKPELQFDLLKELSDKCNIPLVLHGGSGISDEDFTKAIDNGICKININTELQLTWSNAVRKFLNENGSVYDPRKIIASGEKEFKEMAKRYIKIFQNKKEL